MAVNQPGQSDFTGGGSESPDVKNAPDAEVSPTIDMVQVLTSERDDLKDQLLRTRAEMDNIRKRLNRERDEERRYAALPVVRELLPAFDNLQRAVDAGQRDHNADVLLQGVQMVLKQLDDVLSRLNVKTIPSVGLAFDPNVHEALQQVPTAEHPPMTVLQELERGFQIHERVIRPSKVIVAAAPQEK
ncbi:nucleotide exchange factor GrpE [Planctomicrobium piriforme]|uniref:Protein GrpE n=1 Tax=Planctomicrobium piriforme TaxID=1576369 RepID=A0A1I3K639_9PLAN|nr:nucleotide exchange factor GrpE [Planctomicrobium piriforme]SFI67778.1 molecular chaperone GrpE [Planctomicrobium piriforme]